MLQSTQWQKIGEVKFITSLGSSSHSKSLPKDAATPINDPS
jgi:hypothetical protein